MVAEVGVENKKVATWYVVGDFWILCENGLMLVSSLGLLVLSILVFHITRIYYTVGLAL